MQYVIYVIYVIYKNKYTRERSKHNMIFHSILLVLAIPLIAVGLTLILPSNYKFGTVLHDKSRVKYNINGLLVILTASLIFLLGGSPFLNLWNLRYLAENWKEYLLTNLVFSVLFCFFMVFVKPALLPEKKDTTKTHYKEWYMKYWCGSELNPHIFGFEMKFFWYRPGFITWCFLNISFLAEQIHLYGTPSVPMLLYQFISFFYIIDAFWYEYGMTFMFDIIEENFGFMLVWGDYCWIPFVFSLPAKYCLDKFTYSYVEIILNLTLFIVGYKIFRGTNAQKIQFKQDPNKPIWGKKPETIYSKNTGRYLLCSGWWGVARKINYLGDIMIAISMSMPSGYNSLIPHLYPIYLTLLLLNRAYRDDARCKEKHQEAWTEYCNKVKYMMIPGIY